MCLDLNLCVRSALPGESQCRYRVHERNPLIALEQQVLLRRLFLAAQCCQCARFLAADEVWPFCSFVTSHILSVEFCQCKSRLFITLVEWSIMKMTFSFHFKLRFFLSPKECQKRHRETSYGIRETDRQTDRDRQTGRHADRQTDRDRERHTHRRDTHRENKWVRHNEDEYLEPFKSSWADTFQNRFPDTTFMVLITKARSCRSVQYLSDLSDPQTYSGTIPLTRLCWHYRF